MLTPMHGGFLAYPFVLELSLNYCSHGCSYCFANHAAPKRVTGITQLQNLLTHYQERDTLTARLMQHKGLVLVSNRVDAFAHSNYQQAIPILRTLTELEIPYAMASRGGKGVDEVLSFAPRLLWYLSICHDNDDVRKRVEPGAPSLTERLHLAEKLVKRGDAVHLAINPYVPDWWEHFPQSLIPYRDLGIEHVYVQRLHLGQDQMRNMSEKEKQALGQDVITLARKRKHDDAQLAQVCEQLKDMGFRPHNFHEDYKPDDAYEDYWNVYESKSLFPTRNQFISWCMETVPDGEVVTCQDYVNFMESRLPAGSFTGLDHYIACHNRLFFKEYTLPSVLTFRNLLQIFWEYPDASPSAPASSMHFAWAVNKEGQLYVDDNDKPLLVFRRQMYQDTEDTVEMNLG